MSEVYFTSFLRQGIAATELLQKENVPLDASLLKVVAADSQLLTCVYWCVAGLATLGVELTAQLKEDVARFYHSCVRADRGFAQSYRQEPHVLATVSGVQIATLLGLPSPRVHDALWSLCVPSGAFVAYEGGEEDVRFVYAAVLSLYLEQRGRIEFPAHSPKERTVTWLRQCQNVDGGFGSTPGAESHAGHTFCVLATLKLLDERLNKKEHARCCRWLLSRQVGYDSKAFGGLNGRAGKDADSCYTFWVLAAATLLGMPLEESYDIHAIRVFLDSCRKEGGIAKDPDNGPDPFHSFFALAGDRLIDGNFDPMTALPSRIATHARIASK